MHISSKRRNELIRKGRKGLALFLAVVLAIQCANLPIIVSAATDGGEALATVEDTSATEQAPAEQAAPVEESTPVATSVEESEPVETTPVETAPAAPAEPSEPAEPEQSATTDQTPANTTPLETEQSTTTETPAPTTEQNTPASTPAESNSAMSTPAPAEDTTATVALALNQSTLAYEGTTYTSDQTQLEAPANQELKFTVAPADGFEIDTVKQVAADGAETELTADANGEYTITADKVADGLKIDVATTEVPAEPAEEPADEPADDATTEPIEEPVIDEGAEETAEGEEGSEGASLEIAHSTSALVAAPQMLSIKAVDWDSFDAAVSLYDENMQFVASSDYQNVAGGAIADNVESQIEVNGALYDFIGAYVGDNQIGFAGSRGGNVYYAVAADSGIASLLPKGQKVTLRYQEHVNRHDITYYITGIADTDGLVSGASNVINGGSFDFTVRDVYGYEVSVSAAGQILTGNNGVYSISNVTNDITVNVAYRANSSYDFTIPDTVRNSANAHGMMGYSAVPNQSNIAVGDDLTFSFNTVRGQEGANWYLDSLEINDQTVAIPRTYNQGDSATTTLDNGLTVVVTLTEVDDNGHYEGWWPFEEWVTEFPEYTYTVTVSGAKEDVALTFINFVGSSHHEVMPHFDKNAVSVTYTGGVTGTASNEKPIQTTNGTLYFTIEALPGYEVTGVTLDGSAIQPNWQGRYEVSNTTTVVMHLDISSRPISYDVRYDMNGVSGSAPTDSAEYGVALERNLVIAGAPETTEDKVFLGWRLGDKVYQPGEVVDVIGLLHQAQNHTLTFSAEWGTSIQEGQPVTMHVEVYLQKEDGSYPSSPDIRKDELAYGGDVVTVRDPETYLGDRTGYTFNEEKSTNEITLEGTTDTIKLYFDLPTIELTATSGGGVYKSGAYFLKNVNALAGGSDEGITIEYKYGDGDWTTNAPSATNVDDSYNGNISVRARKSGYVTKQVDGLSIVVTKRPVAVTGSAEKPTTETRTLRIR